MDISIICRTLLRSAPGLVRFVGAPVTTDKLKTQSIDAKQIKTVTGRGGELLEFSGFKVEPILGRHGEPPKDVTAAFENALKGSRAEAHG
jgi:hypothetical protein